MLSKPNTKSKRAVFDDANNEEYCVVMLEDIDEVLEMMEIEEEPPMDDEIHPMTKSATDFKGFETLLSSTSTTKCFAPMFKRKLDICMMNYEDRLRRFNKMLTN